MDLRYEIRSDNVSAAARHYDVFLGSRKQRKNKVPSHVKKSSAETDINQHGRNKRGRCLFLAHVQRVLNRK